MIEDFGVNLQKLIEQSLANKTEELKKREQIVTAREEKVDFILKNNHLKGHISIQVGSTLYHTTTDILTSVPDSYFSGLLNPKFLEANKIEYERKEGLNILEKRPLFIARDGEVFKYVLEYLTYGKLFSLPDEANFEKLCIDAEFYLLPELSKQLLEMKKNILTHTKKLPWLKISSSLVTQNGTDINWNNAQNIDRNTFSHAGNTTTILKAGLYHIFVRYSYQCSTHGTGSANIDLYISNAVVARSFHGSNTSYMDSRSIEHLAPLNVNDTIRVRYFSNSNSLNDQFATTLTIICLSQE